MHVAGEEVKNGRHSHGPAEASKASADASLGPNTEVTTQPQGDAEIPDTGPNAGRAGNALHAAASSYTLCLQPHGGGSARPYQV